MFTGIVTDVGRIRAIEQPADWRVTIETAYETGSIDIGASIACDGVCLTVVDKDEGWFAVDVSRATRGCTALADWRVGLPVNLERSLRVGDELGGHIVTGHVDGVGEIIEGAPQEGSRRLRISLPANLARYVAPKGSIAVSGVSLTVNAVEDAPRPAFEVNIIPHTLEKTRFATIEPGEAVNLEIDILARYLERLHGHD